MSLGRASKGFVPARRLGNGSRGSMLFLREVPLLFDLEHLGVVIVDGTSADSLHPSLSGFANG